MPKVDTRPLVSAVEALNSDGPDPKPSEMKLGKTSYIIMVQMKDRGVCDRLWLEIRIG